ncbi:hypothetical protein [Streptomyces sp. NPDC056817]
METADPIRDNGIDLLVSSAASRSGRRAWNWPHNGSVMEEGRAGT